MFNVYRNVMFIVAMCCANSQIVPLTYISGRVSDRGIWIDFKMLSNTS
jgi:hypothetical protein